MRADGFMHEKDFWIFGRPELCFPTDRVGSLDSPFPISGVKLDTQMSEFLLSHCFDVFLKRDEVKPLIRSSMSSGPLLLLVIACRRCREQS